MAATTHAPLSPPTAPPAHDAHDTYDAHDRSRVLANVLSLASLFGNCVEAFNLIHPHKGQDRAQRVALARLGVQQGRLLIFGDAVGISSPPAYIARHMIPSHPGATNPDPTLPVNFAVRDGRLEDPNINRAIREGLDQLVGRPSHLSREELMRRYGLGKPKRFAPIEYPALDTNRLEAFREKYALLQDLIRSTGGKPGVRRGSSIASGTQHWVVHSPSKFDSFVQIVRSEVDALIDLLGVTAQVDKGMRTDIRALGWHPDLSGVTVRADWEKLKLIREACAADYPEYVAATEAALKYINEELRGSTMANLRLSLPPPLQVNNDKPQPQVLEQPVTGNGYSKDKRPSIFSTFRSWKKKPNTEMRERQKSIATPSSQGYQDPDPQRSMSDTPQRTSLEKDRDDASLDNSLTPIRSKSLSAIQDSPAPFNLDSRLQARIQERERSSHGSGGERSGSQLQALQITDDNTFKNDSSPSSPLSPTYSRNYHEKVFDSDPDEDDLDEDSVDPLHVPGQRRNKPRDHRKSEEENALYRADTANSLIERHDMYKGVGRVETRDIRDRAHDFAYSRYEE